MVLFGIAGMLRPGAGLLACGLEPAFPDRGGDDGRQLKVVSHGLTCDARCPGSLSTTTAAETHPAAFLRSRYARARAGQQRAPSGVWARALSPPWENPCLRGHS